MSELRVDLTSVLRLKNRIYYTDLISQGDWADWAVCVCYYWGRGWETADDKEAYEKACNRCAVEAKTILSAYPLHIFLSLEPSASLPTSCRLRPQHVISLVLADRAFARLPSYARETRTSLFAPRFLRLNDGDKKSFRDTFRTSVASYVTMETEDSPGSALVKCVTTRYNPPFEKIKEGAFSELKQALALLTYPDNHDSFLSTSLTPRWKTFLAHYAEKMRREKEELERFHADVEELAALREETKRLTHAKDQVRRELEERRLALEGLKAKVERLQAELETIRL